MNVRRILLQGALAGAIATALLAGREVGAVPKSSVGKQALTSKEAFDIAVEAYIFGYPLVTMDMTRRCMTNVRQPEGVRAPQGQFARIRALPLALDREITVPNADTLYTGTWLDVAREPWVLSLPDPKDRCCLFPVLDGWTAVFAPAGKQTTGTGLQEFAITGPGWKGKLPRGLKEYKSPTSIVWVPGRVYCTGSPEDLAAAHVLQDQCSAVPLSSYGKPYVPPPGQVDADVNMQTSASEQVNVLGPASYFNRLALLMKDNPPVRADAPVVKRMARLGIVPGQPFDIGRLDPAVIQVLQYVPTTALGKIMGSFKEGGKASAWTFQDGWRWTVKIGAYGTDYTQRALIAAVGLGAGRPEDMLYAISTVDGAGQSYSGNFRYVMHFAPGQAPSTNSFWSLTMYGSDYFFVSNPLCRYALRGRDPLNFNPDGSLDLYLQKYPPGADREANWLPAPEDKFMLMLRFYRPQESLINGSWKIPPVKRTD